MIGRVRQAHRKRVEAVRVKEASKAAAKTNLPPFIRVGVVVVPRRTSPYGGVDHGSEGRCLLESRDCDDNQVVHQLVWFAGHWSAAAGVRGFGRVYSPAHLSLITDKGYDAGALIELVGGRLTPARLGPMADEIDRFFGSGSTAIVETGSTIVVISPANAPKRR